MTEIPVTIEISSVQKNFDPSETEKGREYIRADLMRKATEYGSMTALEAELARCMELAKDDFDSILPFADGEDGRFSAEMFTKGRMSLRGSKLDISYEETEATGMQGSTTSLVFDVAKPKTVFMKRRGTHTSNMIFEANKTKSFIYGAEVMTLRINLFTKAVKNSITLYRGGKLDIVYALEINNTQAQLNRIRVTVTRDGT